jgi:hypothetical protein
VVDVSLEVLPSVPPIGRTIPERLTLVPEPTPGLPGYGGGFDWHDGSGGEMGGGIPNSPPVKYPDDSSLGGYTDIDEFGGGGPTGPMGPAGPLADGVPNQEAREVLALLSALQYVPKGEHVVADDVLERLAADVAQLNQPRTSGSESLYTSRFEGGMVGLVRETLVERRDGDVESSGESGATGREERSEVESIQGRFQAFEVSTMEVVPPSAHVEQLQAEAIRLPVVQAALSGGADGGEPGTNRGSLREPQPPGTESGSSEVSPIDNEGRERNVSSNVMAEPGDTATNRALRAAAACVFLLYSSRTARSADVKEPEKGRLGLEAAASSRR